MNVWYPVTAKEMKNILFKVITLCYISLQDFPDFRTQQEVLEDVARQRVRLNNKTI